METNINNSEVIHQLQSNKNARTLLEMVDSLSPQEISEILQIDNALGPLRLTECCFALKAYIEESQEGKPLHLTQKIFDYQMKEYDESQYEMRAMNQSPEEYGAIVGHLLPKFLRMSRDEYKAYFQNESNEELDEEKDGEKLKVVQKLLGEMERLHTPKSKNIFLKVLQIKNIIPPDSIQFVESKNLETIFAYLEVIGGRVATEDWHQEVTNNSFFDKALASNLEHLELIESDFKFDQNVINTLNPNTSIEFVQMAELIRLTSDNIGMIVVNFLDSLATANPEVRQLLFHRKNIENLLNHQNITPKEISQKMIEYVKAIQEVKQRANSLSR